jgi:hypothetical protein
MPRLKDDVRAQRIVGNVHVRVLGGQGKCKTCKKAIKKGERSLRYNEVVYGRKQEVGICLACASKIWHHAEAVVGRISAILQEYAEENPPEAEAEKEKHEASLVVDEPPIVESPYVPPVSPDVFHDAPNEVAERIRRDQKERMEAFFGPGNVPPPRKKPGTF